MKDEAMSEQNGFTYLKDYRPTPFKVEHVEMAIDLHPTATRVKTSISFAPRPGELPSDTLQLDGEALKLVSIAINGKPLARERYEMKEDGLNLLGLVAQPFTLETEVEINPETNKTLTGLFRTGGNYCTQCEADGFRRITYFLDRPDVLSTYRVRVTGNSKTEPYLLSNGNLVESGEAEEPGRHYAIWEDPHPKPSYLFALVAGEFDRLEDEFVTMSGRKVALHLYVEAGKKERGHYAVGALKRAMKWDEDKFGREYDLDIFQIVAVPHFNMGAMENKGLNIFNDKYILADQQTATDGDFINIEAIIAHEYFHNWTGNRITCRDWFQLCLKEGLTVFRDQEFTSDLRDREVKRIEDVRLLRAHQFSEDAGPLAHPVRPEKFREINNFYTATVYEKGAEIVRMLKVILGEDGFRKGMDLYFERHDGDAATVEDFIRCFADANERDLSAFFRWYSQAGTPLVTVGQSYDPASGTLRLQFSQTLPETPEGGEKKPQVIPIRLGIFNRQGRPVETGLEDDLFVLDAEQAELSIENAPEQPVLSLNRGFSAPIRLEDGQSLGEELFLLRHDTDGFNRWEAAQGLAQHFITTRLTGEVSAQEADYAASLGATILDTGLSHAFRAHLLQMPSEQDIARELGEEVDPDAIHVAREGFLRDLSHALGDALRQVMAETEKTIPFRPDAEGSGYRGLKLAARALAAKGDAAVLKELSDMFEKADNMTERFGALAILVREKAPRREAALESFERQFADNPIVLDKWFALQATLPEEDALERLARLTSHPVFSMENPNRVRALIGSFAMGNPTRFHAADGSGYRFVTAKLKEIDSFNPQLAARLANCFGTWQRLEESRRATARRALEELKTQKLSRDLSDMLERTLTPPAG